MKDVLDTPLPDQERLLEMVAESLPVEVLEPRKRVDVLIVGGSNGPFFDTIRELAASRGIDLVAHVAEVTPPREVLFVEGVREAIDRRRGLADILNDIRIEEEFELPKYCLEEIEAPTTEQRVPKNHSYPKIAQFLNNQRSKGPPVRKQFALKRPPRRGNR